MKKKLQDMLAKKEARKKELLNKSQTSNEVNELRSINTEMENLNGEISELRSMMDSSTETTDATPVPTEQRQIIVPQGQLNVLGTYGVAGVQTAPNARSEQRSLDEVTGLPPEEMRGELFKLPEYRSAYLKSLQGKQLNDVEMRAITTAATSGGAAVPTTTYDLIIQKLQQTSVLFPLITTTYIPGNVVLPVANAITAAVWSDEVSDGTFGDDTVAGVSLAGYTLAKYAKISAAAMVMTIDAFETYIVNQIGNQLSIAVENAILNGLGPTPGGSNKPQPTGILPGVTWDLTNSATFATTVGYDDLVGARALLKTPYRPFGKWILNSNMEAALFKIKDSQNRPIFTQAPQNGFEPRILNHPYIVDDYMPDEQILFGAFNYYYMNFSQNPVIEASKEAGFTSASTIYRGILIADGKPALNETFIKLTKAS
jgi:HK97 family phage major capsid protein